VAELVDPTGPAQDAAFARLLKGAGLPQRRAVEYRDHDLSQMQLPPRAQQHGGGRGEQARDPRKRSARPAGTGPQTATAASYGRVRHVTTNSRPAAAAAEMPMRGRPLHLLVEFVESVEHRQNQSVGDQVAGQAATVGIAAAQPPLEPPVESDQLVGDPVVEGLRRVPAGRAQQHGGRATGRTPFEQLERQVDGG
jgi:hypothetical protein